MSNTKQTKRQLERQEREKRSGAVSMLVVVSGSALTLAGVRNDDTLTVSVCLLVAAICFLYLAVTIPSTSNRKISAFIIVLGVFVFFGWRSQKRIVMSKEEEIFDRLDIQMGQIDAGKPAFLFYTVKNGSHSTITGHQATCIYNKVKDSTDAAIVVPPGVSGVWSDIPIAPGGDGYTGRCKLGELFSFNGPIVCADVTLKFAYESDIEAHETKTKSMRFVAAQITGAHWYQESLNAPSNYCDGIAGRE